MSVSISPPGPAAPARPTREPSLLDALAPVVVLIGLLVLTIVLFGTAAADGPLQVALFLSATFAGLVAYKNGYTAVAIEEAAVGGVSSAMGAIFILLGVEEPLALIHAPNESVDPAEIAAMALTEALFLRRYAAIRR